MADELFKNAGLEIRPFLIMVQQVLLLKAGKELDLNSCVFSYLQPNSFCSGEKFFKSLVESTNALM